jgi:hypothetical protein
MPSPARTPITIALASTTGLTTRNPAGAGHGNGMAARD